MKIKIRKAKAKDIPEIAEIYKKEYSRKPYNEKWSMKTLLRKLRCHLKWNNVHVVIIDNEIVGFVIFNYYEWDDGLRIYVEDLAVSGNFQGKGLGKTLMKSIEKEGKKRGVKVIMLDVNIKSKAFKLHKSLGYKNTHYKKLEKNLK